MVKKVNFFKKKSKSLFGSKKPQKEWFKFNKNSVKDIKKIRNYIIIITIITLLIIGLNYVVNKTIFLPKYNITQVNFSEKTLEVDNNPYLFKDIKQYLIGKNYFIVSKFKKGSIESEIKEKYKTVKNLDIFFVSDNNIWVDITFSKPNIIFQSNIGYLGSKNWVLYEIFSWSILLSWAEFIHLPEYFNYKNESELEWFFYLTKEKDLTFQIAEIKDFIGKDKIEKITYLPWWWKTILNLVNKKNIYFDNTKSITDQIDKLVSLQKNYTEYETITEIDLWSMDNIIIKQ